MPTIFTITQINNNIDSILQTKFDNISITGEISSFNISPSGHGYYTLKDKDSELSCVIFSQYLNKCKSILVPGNSVVATGCLSIYKPKGNFQFKSFSVSSIGQGQFWKEYEKLKLKLSNEGLFDEAHKKKIPRYIKNLFIITSLNGVVKNDIIEIIKRRANYQKIFLYPTSVQGKDAAPQISGAIDDINNRYKADTIIIARGGGSVEDLWPFNDEKVARSIFKSSIPIISAIGHETDYTISDFVSDKRASTPSDAAKIVSLDQQELLQYLDENLIYINNFYKNTISSYNENLLELKSKKVLIDPIEPMKIIKNRISDIYKIININASKILNIYKTKIDILNSNISNLNPYTVIDRGYTLLLDNKRKGISKIDDINIGDQLYSIIRGGELKMEVITKNVKKRK